eukprot:TRINITY_DN66820_c8_g8_i1.p1 TRINITY_DN66820_c8_g8~~TRINITY_DN66820_c8_g8_i1.p1  ORF type:complete len:382 (-),score=240.16 TRINITY_DN66820_c8_g8_i1:52-1164(-)
MANDDKKKSNSEAAAAPMDIVDEEKKEKKQEEEEEEEEQEKSGRKKAVARTLPHTVVLHPIVLLSVVDHYNRVAKDTNKRVVGILLGETFKGRVDVTNSYAVPFEEEGTDIWFLDHNYHENMYTMFNKVNAKEKVVGWYSTGPKIRPQDLQINELLRKYTPHPVLSIIDVNPADNVEIPTTAYLSVETVGEERSQSRHTFQHLACEVGASEAEEVGVEHLLRDIRDTTSSSVADQVQAKLASLKALHKRMREMHDYLELVASGKLPPNNKIIYNMQNAFNLSPNLQVEELVRAFTVKTNDNMLVIYLASLIRSIIALHNLINNKLTNQELERKQDEQLEKEGDKTTEDLKQQREDAKSQQPPTQAAKDGH